MLFLLVACYQQQIPKLNSSTSSWLRHISAFSAANNFASLFVLLFFGDSNNSRW